MFEVMQLNPWHWLGLAAVLGVFELAVGASFFLLWLAVCASSIAAIIAIFPGLSWQYQLLIFAIEAVACIWFWRAHLKNNVQVSDKPNLNKRSAQLVGRTVSLEEAIVNGRGKVKLDGSTWIVEGDDLPAGTMVVITAARGTVLAIKKQQ